MKELRTEVLPVKLTEGEKSLWFRLAGILAAKRGKRVSVGAMLRELVEEKADTLPELQRRIKQ